MVHPHRSLEERTECVDDKDLDNIKTIVNNIVVQCEYKNKVAVFQLQAAGKIIQPIVQYVGFDHIFELSCKHVEYIHKSITSSPINFWLHEKNAAFVGLDTFLSSETNVILNIVLGIDTLTGVGLNYIYRTHLFSLLSFQVEFLVPNLYLNAVSTGLSTSRPHSV